MKILFSLCLFLLGSLAGFSQENSRDTLRILCYNIHYGQGNDGVYELERLAEVIRESKPDIVALQEVDVVVERSGKVHQARKLGELTGMAVRYGPTQHYQGGLYGNAVLTNLPILDVLIHPLPYTEATPEKTTYPRAAIAVTVKGPEGNPVRFISTHFQHNVEEDRIEQAKAINQLFAGDEIPSILAGDMNAVPGSEPINLLEKKWIHAGKEPFAPTAPSKDPRSRIDYIFYRPASSFEVISEKVIDEPMASDHCPVFSELKLRPSN
ncbi:MAG: endonuclease/exonuclease/phosphatase family protein [Verrucomicrobiales bacterium]|nr:endonuclease/exonuclease/phosphatase family protein [Verrucomicrobiales bacterium]